MAVTAAGGDPCFTVTSGISLSVVDLAALVELFFDASIPCSDLYSNRSACDIKF